MSGLKQILAADLFANTGGIGVRNAISAAIYDVGFSTVLFHRLASCLHARGWRRLGKLLWRLNVTATACHLHLEATIAPGLKLPHPTGVVIGCGAKLGARVTVYQNVTIGAGLRDVGYPDIGDDSLIFPNAVLVGGITIGPRAVIGAGSLVIIDVPPDAVVAGSPAKVLRINHLSATPP